MKKTTKYFAVLDNDYCFEALGGPENSVEDAVKAIKDWIDYDPENYSDRSFYIAAVDMAQAIEVRVPSKDYRLVLKDGREIG